MVQLESNVASAPRSQETAEFDVALNTCKFCGTVAHPDDEKNCSSLEEAYRQYPARPYGCPWFTKEDRARAAKPATTTFDENVSFIAGELDRMQKRIARLEADLLECREYIETEVDVVDGSYGVLAPNRAMSLVSMIDETLNGRPY